MTARRRHIYEAGMLFILLSLHLLTAVASDAVVRVKLLHAHTGRPYVNRDVQLFGARSTSGLLRAKDTVFHLQTRTGADGIALFQIPSVPYRFLVYTAQNTGCAPNGSFVAEDILHQGAVAKNTCPGRSRNFHWQDVKPQPGMIVIFALEPRGP